MATTEDTREAIEREAVAAAAMYPQRGVRHYPRPSFRFDLNDFGPVRTPVDPKSVLTLVEIMREHDGNEHGHHSAMLEQIAERPAFGEDLVDWNRVHAARDFGREPGQVSLRDWLLEQGHPYLPPDIRKAFDEWERGDRYLSGGEDVDSSEAMGVFHSAKKLLDSVKGTNQPLSAFVPDEAVRARIEAHAAEYDDAEELEQNAYEAYDQIHAPSKG